MGLKEKLIQHKSSISYKINIYDDMTEDEESRNGFSSKMNIARKVQALLANEHNNDKSHP